MTNTGEITKTTKPNKLDNRMKYGTNNEEFDTSETIYDYRKQTDKTHRDQAKPSNSRVCHDISQRFKDRENKYGGTDEEDLSEFLSVYDTVSIDYELTDNQKLQFMHNLFKRQALRFFNTTARSSARTYEQAKELMVEQFNSENVRSRVLNQLQSIRFVTYVRSEGSRTKALSVMSNYIQNQSTKCPLTHQEEAHRVGFLKRAIIREPWARPIIREVNEKNRYQEFYQDFANALQLEEEIDQSAQSSKRSILPVDLKGKPEIFFNQPRYAKQIAGIFFSGYQHDNRYWNCGKRVHTHHKCSQRPNPVKIAAAKAIFLEKKISQKFRKPGMSSSKQVLFELAEEMRNLFGAEDDYESDDQAATFFGMNFDSDTESEKSSDTPKTSDHENQVQFNSHEPNEYF